MRGIKRLWSYESSFLAHFEAFSILEETMIAPYYVQNLTA